MKLLTKSTILIFFFTSSIFAANPDPAFKKYWYQGKAELTRYDLKQVRYGEIHKGESVLIFVTEPFLKDKQVKYEGEGDRSNAVSVLKINFTRKFFTGIYPYSTMTSVFTPVSPDQKTLKVASSVQEWCGQTYSQLNLTNNQYRGEFHSYFQEEADQELTFPAGWLEDEIWTRLRLSPDSLPVGQFEMIPGMQYARFAHRTPKAEKATGKMENQGSKRKYSIEYPEIKRKLSVEFEKDFPYAIVGWEESGPGGFGADSPILTTRAVRTKSILLDYWNKHDVKDSVYRQQLGVGAN